MKTFKYVSMALTAIAMGACFTACSEDEDVNGKDNGNGNTGKEKKLVEVVINDDEGGYEKYTMEYAKDGKLASLQNEWAEDNEGEGSITWDYTWEGNAIIQKRRSEENDEPIKYILQGNLIKSITMDKHFTLEYNSSKRLTAINSNGESESYVWDGDKLKSISDNFLYSYNGKTCKGYMPCVFASDMEYFVLQYIQPGLMGLNTNQLPSECVFNRDHEREVYKYTFDADGYVKTCKATRHRNDDDEPYEYTMTLKWE